MIDEIITGLLIVGSFSTVGWWIDNSLAQATKPSSRDVLRSSAVKRLQNEYAKTDMSIDEFESRLNLIVQGAHPKSAKPKLMNRPDTWRERAKREIASVYRIPSHQIIVAENRPEFVFPANERARAMLEVVRMHEEDFEVDRDPVNLADNIMLAKRNGLISNDEAIALMDELVHRRQSPFQRGHLESIFK